MKNLMTMIDWTFSILNSFPTDGEMDVYFLFSFFSRTDHIDIRQSTMNQRFVEQFIFSYDDEQNDQVCLFLFETTKPIQFQSKILFCFYSTRQRKDNREGILTSLLDDLDDIFIHTKREKIDDAE